MGLIRMPIPIVPPAYPFASNPRHQSRAEALRETAQVKTGTPRAAGRRRQATAGVGGARVKRHQGMSVPGSGRSGANHRRAEALTPSQVATHIAGSQDREHNFTASFIRIQLAA